MNKCLCAAVVLILVVAACVIAVVLAIGPAHASCEAYWEISQPCDVVRTALVNQIGAWTTDENCADGGEKCLYTLLDVTDDKIHCAHETPVHHYVDDVTFTLSPSDDGGVCTVRGFSTSTVTAALLDEGTNYCNMMNLITGAGLDQFEGFTEDTSDAICTQRSTADCDVY